MTISASADIGSYLSVMQIIKHPNISDEVGEEGEDNLITLLCGTVEGKFNIFKVELDFLHNNEGMIDGEIFLDDSNPKIGGFGEKKYSESIDSDFSREGKRMQKNGKDENMFSKFKD